MLGIRVVVVIVMRKEKVEEIQEVGRSVDFMQAKVHSPGEHQKVLYAPGSYDSMEPAGSFSKISTFQLLFSSKFIFLFLSFFFFSFFLFLQVFPFSIQMMAGYA